jgi:hydrophobe/amphiphile efflux-1 (HAE1) family protein
MRLSDVSIQKPVFAWMLMASLLVFGGIGVTRLGVSKMPDVDFPQVTVNLRFLGAAPEVMESDVVEIVEDACMTVEGIKDISSVSKQDSATVTVEFELGRDIDAALQDVQTKIAQAQRRLPLDMDPPVCSKQNPEDQPIMSVSLSGPLPPAVVSDMARYTVKERLQTVPGVGEITLSGHRERNVRVWIDEAGLDARGLTATDVIAAIGREHVDLPAGRIESVSREMNVRMQGEAVDLTQFRDLVVADRGGMQVRLRDVAVVEDGLEDRRVIARTNGLQAQGLGIKKQRGANAIAVADAVKKRVLEIRKDLPEELSLDVTFDSTEPVKDSIHEIGFTIALSVLLTAIVCWMFLGSISSTINVLLAIPTSLVGTFAVMYFLGFTLNTFTLLGLSLAVGIVVDDAIMVLENIFRHAEEGETRIRAAVAGAREIAFAALAATAAIIAIFLPVAFMKGIIGAFFFQFGVTISVAVLLSLLEALTLTPSRSAQFLSVGKRTTWFGRAVDGSFEWMARAYRRTLVPALRWRWLSLGAGVAVFAVSFWIAPKLRAEMTPSQDIGRVLATIKTPVGSSIDFTDDRVRRCEAMLAGRPEFPITYVAIGGFGGGDVNTANVFVTMPPADQRTITMQQAMAELRKKWNAVPGVRAIIQDLSIQGFTATRGYGVEFNVRGPDWGKLVAEAQSVMAKMRESDLLTDVDTDYQVGMPELQIRPDRGRAAAMGVSMEAIAETVNALVGGVRAGQFKDKGRNYDVRVRLLGGQRMAPEDIGRLKVRARDGTLVPLSALVSVDTKPTLLAVTRRSRERAITITANVPQGKSQSDAVEAVRAIGEETLSRGYTLNFSGSAQVFKDAGREAMFALLLGVVVAYMILAAQFNSFAHPVSVLAAMPLSLTGALAALWICDLSINMYSAIGILLLMGIVKKNSILLVEFTNHRRILGETRDEALLYACPARLRPILMTTISTIVGAVPAAVAIGPGAELRQPMAVAVIGGLTLSTRLTLYVVPALYSVLDSLSAWLSRWLGSAAGVERETLAVLADLTAEDVEKFRHRRGDGPQTTDSAPVPGGGD